MNSYNENLRSTVVATLQNQYLDQRTLKSQLNAAVFTLYHAEGAAITADEKFEAAKTAMRTKEHVKEQAVINSNISNNLAASATQGDQYVKQAVTNMAVCAANVQVANNAIVKLASDIGSIYGIVHAADYLTDTYSGTKTVADLMNETAYYAELASQFAMEASSLTSEISSSTVLDKAKSTNSLVNNLLSISAADFDATSAIVAADNVILATANTSEKIAEGALEDISVDYKAAKDAYSLLNSELNLTLNIAPVSNTDSKFQISFDTIRSAFKQVVQPKTNVAGATPAAAAKVTVFPAQDYYWMAVKDSKKFTFSVSNAQNLLLENKYESIIHVKAQKISRITKKFDFFKMHNNLPGGTTDNPEFALNDADGEPIIQGQKYVIFLMAVYTDTYKREINNFDDFLSAPSTPFNVTISIPPINSATFKIRLLKDHPKNATDLLNEQNFAEAQIHIADEDEDQPDLAATNKPTPVDYVQSIEFHVAHHFDSYSPEYRCIILPADAKLTKGMLTNIALDALLEDEIPDLERIAAIMDPLITAVEEDQLQTKLIENELDTSINDTIDVLKQIILKLSKGPHGNREKIIELEAIVNLLNKGLLLLDGDPLQALIQERAKQINALGTEINNTPGIFFNLALAEQVSAGNYATAVQLVKLPPKSATVKQGTSEPVPGHFIAYVGPETTDNFGNPLVEGKNYLPVILSVSLNELDNPTYYTNSISNIDLTKAFPYNQHPAKN